MENQKKNRLYLFTSKYPFGNGEVFVGNEIKVLSRLFDQIYIFPDETGSGQRDLPPNAEVHLIKKEARHRRNMAFLLFNFSTVVKVLAGELSAGLPVFLKYLRHNLAVIRKAIQCAELLEMRPGGTVFYSFWMNDWALVLAILRYQGKIDKFIFRVHGYDLYDHMRPDAYIPFRRFILTMCDSVYTVSKAGQEYLNSRNIFPEKIKMSHLGVFDHGMSPFDPHKVFTLVSCSNLNRNKRVNEIIEVLKNIHFPVKWIHFGGQGDWLSVEELKSCCVGLPSGVEYEFRGPVKNEDLMVFYKQNHVNLFIHLTLSEGGVPVVLQEAASFGIPMLGADTGGVPEIVNEDTGVLVENNFKAAEVAKKITEFRDSSKNTQAFHDQVKKIWKEIFSAEINYRAFYNQIIA